LSGREPVLSELMAAAQGGDQEAYRRLLAIIQPIVFRYVRRRVPSNSAAEDVCQEVLLTIHRVRHTYDPQRPFEPWLYAIARSRVIDHLRRARRISGAEVMMEILPEIPQIGGEMTDESALEILDRLPTSQREAFVMLKIEGLSTREAADRAGITVSAVKVRAHRAYNALKKALLPDEQA
jgi:RNA polymerase sigma-70 factor (ECF subfamily)